MNMSQNPSGPIVISRDCDAILIPAGDLIVIPAESVVFITQALGGNYTVNVNGNLAQIGAKDADALGFEIEVKKLQPAGNLNEDGSLKEEVVWDEMRNCYDPEIPHNIVDLGLVYDCLISRLIDGGHRVDIVMTLTSPGCGMGEFLAADVKYRILSLPEVKEVNVEITFEPFWTPEMMTEAVRLELGFF